MRQYSKNNAWNVNMNNGNLNNNNKYNAGYVQAVADFKEQNGFYPIQFEDILEAYFDCLKNKSNTLSSIDFQVNYLQNCLQLYKDILTGAYNISESICFVIGHPCKREIFAANFRDRIIHHYIALRINPLFEDYLPEVICCNRVNKGTLTAINYLQRYILESPNNYWIFRFDLRAFFMNINKYIVNDLLQDFIDKNYFKDDKIVLKYLIELVCLHCPQNNCIKQSPDKYWDMVEPSKSLFNKDYKHGFAIGNLSSQLFISFILGLIVKYLNEQNIKYIVNYADDFVILGEKQELLNIRSKLQKFLQSNLEITLHPKKQYLQHQSKGVKFIGAYIKPNIKYISGRTLDRFHGKLLKFINTSQYVSLTKRVSTINSYLGLMKHFNSYKIRKNFSKQIIKCFNKEIYFKSKFKSIKIRKKYTTQFLQKQKICKLRKSYIN